jgi:Flp pilus assembly protein TadG
MLSRPTIGARLRLSRRRTEYGAAAVEFALVLPVVVMLLLGIVTGGLAYSNGIGLSNAVREGARFGATGDSASATWASDVIARVRATQFDDDTVIANSKTSVCVQLWKYSGVGSNAGTEVKAACSLGGSPDAPPLAMPAKDSAPNIPPSTTAATCVVRVYAARKYEITLGVFPSLPGTMNRGSVARYERTTC